MNGAAVCHEVQDCPGLYVDAFRGKYLRRTQNPDNAFVLTHYHGDHYQNLPREGKYGGPALIHCTPVTASLLVRVHQVPERYVVEHAYGQTFDFLIPFRPTGKRKNSKSTGHRQQKARITFYDANHCPGACIVLIQLPNGTTHLHTGDMRYHEKFRSYPLLREAVDSQKLDIVYLDTTYCHPKHDFVAQTEAIDTIAEQTEELLGPGRRSDQPQEKPKTLVLLSCYSIGKEKVLWEAATRTNQMVYVSDKKMRMLQCCSDGAGGNGSAAKKADPQPSNPSRKPAVEEDPMVASKIVHRCTTDARQSDLHVIPMGLAGEIWPFFRPNFLKCAKYVRDLEEEHECNQRYDKVVAFLPTGWAHGSKWNREHAVSKKTVPIDPEESAPTTTTEETPTVLANGRGVRNGPTGPVEHRTIDVEVRLVPYSEHSTFSELVAFVQFLKPRKVIPTVFGDDAEYRKIEHRFRNLLDSTRAKKAFFQTMTRNFEPSPILSASNASTVTKHTPQPVSNKNPVLMDHSGSIANIAKPKVGRNEKDQTATPPKTNTCNDGCAMGESEDEIEIIKVESMSPCTHPTFSPDDSHGSIDTPKGSPEEDESSILKIVAMGFPREQASRAIRACRGNLDRALEMILTKSFPSEIASNVCHNPSELPLSANDKKRKEAPYGGILTSTSSSTENSSGKKKPKTPSKFDAGMKAEATTTLITSFFAAKSSPS